MILNGRSKGSSNILVIALGILVIALAGSSAYLYSQNATLTSNLATVSTNYNSLQDSYTALYNDYTPLQNSYSILNSDYNTLQSSYNLLMATKTSLQTQFNSLSAQFSALNNSYNALMDDYEDLLARVPPEEGIMIESMTWNHGVMSASGITSVTIRNLGDSGVTVNSLKLYYNGQLQSSVSVSITIAGNSTATINEYLKPSVYELYQSYYLHVYTLEGYTAVSDPIPLVPG